MKTIYRITFTIDGRQHSCTGRSDYPSKKNYETGNYLEEVVDSNARHFIKLYKEQYGFKDMSYSISNISLEFEN